jgi:HD domain-containing protein
LFWRHPGHSAGRVQRYRYTRTPRCRARPGCASASRSRPLTSLRRTGSRSPARWTWPPGCTPPTGGSASPYLSHLLRVTIRILSQYHVRDADVAAAALLHHAVEDHAEDIAPGFGQPEALAAIAAQFGNRVAALIAAVTNPDYEPGRDHGEQYREHVAASLESSPWARVIKISDFTDNGAGLIHTTGPKLGKLAAKYAPLVPVLRELIARPDTRSAMTSRRPSATSSTGRSSDSPPSCPRANPAPPPVDHGPGRSIPASRRG